MFWTQSYILDLFYILARILCPWPISLFLTQSKIMDLSCILDSIFFLKLNAMKLAKNHGILQWKEVPQYSYWYINLFTSTSSPYLNEVSTIMIAK